MLGLQPVTTKKLLNLLKASNHVYTYTFQNKIIFSILCLWLFSVGSGLKQTWTRCWGSYLRAGEEVSLFSTTTWSSFYPTGRRASTWRRWLVLGYRGSCPPLTVILVSRSSKEMSVQRRQRPTGNLSGTSPDLVEGNILQQCLRQHPF